MRTHYKKREAKTPKYRNYEKFNNEELRSVLLNKLMYQDSQSKQLQDSTDSVLHVGATNYR